MLAEDIEVEKFIRREEKKKKKAVTLSLTEENVEFLKKNLKVSLSFIVDDFLGFITKQVKKEIKEEREKGENAKED